MVSSEVTRELESTEKIIRDLACQEAVYFRLPYGKKLVILSLHISNNNIKTITWDDELAS
jgi:peptidoglycan/xylan/chitin deacetylase (PgdA/CDA1 family)